MSGLRLICVALFCLCFFAGGISGQVPDRTVPQNHLVLIGATEKKEFYTTQDFPSGIGDFAMALNHICPNILSGMELVAVETYEEFQVLDNWLLTQYAIENDSERFWTSGENLRKHIKDKAGRWATTDELIEFGDWPTGFFGPSPAPYPGNCDIGCWDQIPHNSWNRCLAITPRCTWWRWDPPNTCNPLRTEFFYEDCREPHRVICQKRL